VSPFDSPGAGGPAAAGWAGKWEPGAPRAPPGLRRSRRLVLGVGAAGSAGPDSTGSLPGPRWREPGGEAGVPEQGSPLKSPSLEATKGRGAGEPVCPRVSRPWRVRGSFRRRQRAVSGYYRAPCISEPLSRDYAAGLWRGWVALSRFLRSCSLGGCCRALCPLCLIYCWR